LEGLRGEDSIAELCRREGIAQNLYYRWSENFLEAGKKRLAGDTARAATSDEVKDLRREATALKEVVADLTLENRLLKKSVTEDVASRTVPCCGALPAEIYRSPNAGLSICRMRLRSISSCMCRCGITGAGSSLRLFRLAAAPLGFRGCQTPKSGSSRVKSLARCYPLWLKANRPRDD
jgi:transposase